MKNKVLIIGGSQGLGKVIASEWNEGDEITIVSRYMHRASEVINQKCNRLTVDLSKDTQAVEEWVSTNISELKFVIFTQRYRNEAEANICYQKEYETMVVSTARIIDAIIKSNDIGNIINVVIIGSTYIDQVGFDQGWNYTAIKSAQKGIMKHYSINGQGKLNISMISPGPYIKNESNEWKNKSQFSIWKNFISNGLPKVDEVARAIIEYCKIEGRLLNGQNIKLDSGLSNLYPDQVDKQNYA